MTAPQSYHRPVPEALTPQCLQLGVALVQNAVQDIENFLDRRKQKIARLNTVKTQTGKTHTYNTLENLTVHAMEAVLWLQGIEPNPQQQLLHGVRGVSLSFVLICDVLNADADLLWSGLCRRFRSDPERCRQWRRLQGMVAAYQRYTQERIQQTGLLRGRLWLATELAWELTGSPRSNLNGLISSWVYRGRNGKTLPCCRIDGRIYTTRKALQWFFADAPYTLRTDALLQEVAS